jgi:hypothetical protein
VGDPLQTEFGFTLPRGYVDEAGTLHRDGVMRIARAIDEVAPFDDKRAIANEAYLSILLLSRVVVRLGNVSPVPPAVVEKLFASDFAYLQELYISVNDEANRFLETECPACGERFGLDLLSEATGAGDRKATLHG